MYKLTIPSLSLPSAIESMMPAIIDLANQQKHFSKDTINNFANSFFDYRNSLDEVDFPIFYQAISHHFPQIYNNLGAGFLALFIGGKIEDDQLNPQLTLPSLFNSFIYRLTHLPQGEIWDEEKQEVHIHPLPLDEDNKQGLEFIGNSLVAHLVHTPSLKKALAGDHKLIHFLEARVEQSLAVLWLYYLLLQHEADLIVLHTEERCGIRVKYKNLFNCGQIIAFLQGIVEQRLPGARKNVDQRIMQTLLSEQPAPCQVTNWWHYKTTNPLINHRQQGLRPEIASSSLPVIDEHQVLLISTTSQPHVWSSHLLTPFLMNSPPHMEITGILSPLEAEQWLAKAGIDHPLHA